MDLLTSRECKVKGYRVSNSSDEVICVVHELEDAQSCCRYKRATQGVVVVFLEVDIFLLSLRRVGVCLARQGAHCRAFVPPLPRRDLVKKAIQKARHALGWLSGLGGERARTKRQVVTFPWVGEWPTGRPSRVGISKLGCPPPRWLDADPNVRVEGGTENYEALAVNKTICRKSEQRKVTN